MVYLLGKSLLERRDTKGDVLERMAGRAGGPRPLPFSRRLGGNLPKAEPSLSHRVSVRRKVRIVQLEGF